MLLNKDTAIKSFDDLDYDIHEYLRHLPELCENSASTAIFRFADGSVYPIPNAALIRAITPHFKAVRIGDPDGNGPSSTISIKDRSTLDISSPIAIHQREYRHLQEEYATIKDSHIKCLTAPDTHIENAVGINSVRVNHLDSNIVNASKLGASTPGNGVFGAIQSTDAHIEAVDYISRTEKFSPGDAIGNMITVNKRNWLLNDLPYSPEVIASNEIVPPNNVTTSMPACIHIVDGEISLKYVDSSTEWATRTGHPQLNWATAAYPVWDKASSSWKYKPAYTGTNANLAYVSPGSPHAYIRGTRAIMDYPLLFRQDADEPQRLMLVAGYPTPTMQHSIVVASNDSADKIEMTTSWIFYDNGDTAKMVSQRSVYLPPYSAIEFLFEYNTDGEYATAWMYPMKALEYPKYWR